MTLEPGNPTKINHPVSGDGTTSGANLPGSKASDVSAVGVDMRRGWIKLYRKLRESEIAAHPNTLSVFIHILLDVVFHEKDKSAWGYILKPGQTDITQDQLALRCGLGRRAVQGAVSKLVKMKTITQHRPGRRRNIITLLNWDTYQVSEPEPGQGKGDDGAKKGQRRGTPEEGKNGKTGKKKPCPPAVDFNDFYQHYPKKVGKEDAIKAWSRMSVADKRKSVEVVPVMGQKWAGIKVKDPRMKFCPFPATWLNGGRWDDDQDAWGPKGDVNPRDFKSSQLDDLSNHKMTGAE